MVSIVLSAVPASDAAEAPAATTSPRIETLRGAAPAERAAAEEALWMDLRRSGTPLVEPIAGDPEHSRVTFLWQGEPSLRNVSVITAMSLSDLPGSALEQVPGTRTWARTYVLPNDARLGYRFAPDDSGVPFEQERDVMKRMQGWRTDPLNPRRAPVAPGIDVSVLELPAAAPSRWSQPDAAVPHGTVREVQVPLGDGGGSRKGWVYLPAGGAVPGALVIFLDGQSYTTLIPGPTILDNLIAARAIRPVAALFLAAADDREAEYGCNEAFADRLAGEVLGFARRETRVQPVAARTVLVGDSLAGLQAACAALAHPKQFGAVLTQSGSFFRAPAGEPPESVARRLSGGAHAPDAWWLEVGCWRRVRFRAGIPPCSPRIATSGTCSVPDGTGTGSGSTSEATSIWPGGSH
jgi:enterochelin esterase family protein